MGIKGSSALQVTILRKWWQKNEKWNLDLQIPDLDRVEYFDKNSKTDSPSLLQCTEDWALQAQQPTQEDWHNSFVEWHTKHHNTFCNPVCSTNHNKSVPKHPSKCQSASDLHRRAEVTACKKNMIRAWLVKCRREKTPLCTSKQTFLKRHFHLQRNAKNSPKSRVAIFWICHHAQTHAILREVCPFLTTHLFKLVRFQINPVFVTPSIA